MKRKELRNVDYVMWLTVGSCLQHGPRETILVRSSVQSVNHFY